MKIITPAQANAPPSGDLPAGLRHAALQATTTKTKAPKTNCCLRRHSAILKCAQSYRTRTAFGRRFGCNPLTRERFRARAWTARKLTYLKVHSAKAAKAKWGTRCCGTAMGNLPIPKRILGLCSRTYMTAITPMRSSGHRNIMYFTLTASRHGLLWAAAFLR